MPTFLLFLAPHPPVPLPAEGVALIGRSRESTLRLPDADTSRRHAKIACGRDGHVIHDLGSTNGTFVNGVRVESRALSPGDRIQIGGNHITFCRVGDIDLDTGDDGASTVLYERPSRPEAFQGDLTEIPPFAVLQILEMGRKTGCLVLDSDATPGRLWLRRGAPVHAETKSQVGFDAALALVNATAGSFAFEPLLDTPEPTIQASVTDLLLEAARRIDEGLA